MKLPKFQKREKKPKVKQPKTGLGFLDKVFDRIRRYKPEPEAVDVPEAAPKEVREEENKVVLKEVEADSNVWRPENAEEFLEGTLTNKEKTAMGGMKYTLKLENNEEKVFFGSTVLNDLLDKCEIGDKMKIIFKGLKPSKIAGRQPLKLWKVYRDVPEQQNVQ